MTVQESIGKVLKRRGLIAGAAAMVAGIAAKQASEPVRAASDFNYVAKDGSGTAFDVSTSGYGTGVSATGTNYGFYSSVAGGYGLFAVTTSGAAGVYGGAGSSGSNGVQGVGGGTGVRGESTIANGIGVRGQIPATVGIAPPMTNTAPSTIAVYGENMSSNTGGSPGNGGFGCYGYSLKGHGLVGATGTAGGGAVVGATNGVAGAWAGIFYGPVAITGGKSAAVKNDDGSHSLLYCVESPESWFEDFGAGELVSGKADIKIDPQFAKVANMAKYHVFLTEHDTHHHLSVSGRSASGFTVAADAEGAKLKGKQVADLVGTFSYRIVAKRKDIAGERFARVHLPSEPTRKP